MKVLKFSSTGPDALYLTKADIFFGVLFTLAIFRNGWPEGEVAPRDSPIPMNRSSGFTAP